MLRGREFAVIRTISKGVSRPDWYIVMYQSGREMIFKTSRTPDSPILADPFSTVPLVGLQGLDVSICLPGSPARISLVTGARW